MKICGINLLIWNYRASLIPSATVLAALLLLSILGKVLGCIEQPIIDFTMLPGLPTNLDEQAYYEIARAGIWWLLSTYVFWVTGILTILVCLFVINRSLISYNKKIIRNNNLLLVILLAVLSVLAGAYAIEISYITAQDTLSYINEIAKGSRHLADLTYALGLVAIIYLLIASGYILVPANHAKDVIRRVKLLNLILYTGSILIVFWLLQSRFLYYYSATLFIEEQKQLIQLIAPYLTLAIGGVASILLLLMYLSAFLWLQICYVDLTHDDKSSKSIFDHLNDEKSPAQLLVRHWTRIVAVISPALPGLFETLFNMSATVPSG